MEKKSTRLNPVDFAKKLEEICVGEIVINSIGNEETMKGYELKILQNIRNNVSVPLTIIGGLGLQNTLKRNKTVWCDWSYCRKYVCV